MPAGKSRRGPLFFRVEPCFKMGGIAHGTPSHPLEAMKLRRRILIVADQRTRQGRQTVTVGSLTNRPRMERREKAQSNPIRSPWSRGRTAVPWHGDALKHARSNPITGERVEGLRSPRIDLPGRKAARSNPILPRRIGEAGRQEIARSNPIHHLDPTVPTHNDSSPCVDKQAIAVRIPARTNPTTPDVASELCDDCTDERLGPLPRDRTQSGGTSGGPRDGRRRGESRVIEPNLGRASAQDRTFREDGKAQDDGQEYVR